LILIIDNYDSFTYNLVQYVEEMGACAEVRRNDCITTATMAALRPDAIIISPGPGLPESAGVSLQAIEAFSGRIPILGVCLGHQAIARAFGGRIVRAPTLMHGKTSRIRHDGRTVFRALPNPFEATRYHSLVVDPGSVPAILEVSATTEDGVIMGLRHRRHDTEGVQFHPESILTLEGKALLGNFLARTVSSRPAAGIGG
jgi:anthranilate synthase/aminodeoxychorismate synthase-like glutamine amidotransferase